MKRNDINKNLFAAVSELIPQDEYEKISARLVSAPSYEKAGIKMTVKKQNSKVISFKKFAGVAVAAAVAVVVGLFGFNYYSNNLAVASIIDIDVNPSVELTANKQDKVLDVKAVNEDGKAILGDMELRNTDMDVAVNAVIGAMVSGGYLEGQDNEILITVKNDDDAHAEELKSRISQGVDASLENYKVSSAIINQTINKDSQPNNAQKFAEEQGISIGKASFVLKLAEKNETLKAEELAKLSLREIADIVATNKIDISDIADHDPDDSIWENIADTVEDVNEQSAESNNSTSSNNGVITKKKAREIALKDAGLKESEVIFVEQKLDSEKGKKVYEIEFYHDSTEYDYEIDANTGKILSSDLDIEDYDIPVESKKNETSSKNNSTSQNVIGVDKAKKAALQVAGVKSADAKFSKTELDNDDGKKYYEIEFKAKGYEYDYKIDAKSGAVLKSDKEKDDDYVEPISKTETSEISKSKAKKAALSHAGVKSSDATFDRIELDKDDGKKYYEIEFKAKGYEYDYEIDAQSGAVLKSDKEKDEDYVDLSSKATSTKISKSAAKKAAFKHAGVKESEVHDLSVEYDEDDGQKIYEIEFNSGNTEYSYEINAVDGSVISHEKEIDD